MGFKKEIENRKKFIEVKNKVKDVVNSVTKTVQDTVQTTVDNLNINIDSLNTKQFKKDVYGKVISNVESLIIESNIESSVAVEIGLDEIAEIIMNIAADDKSKELAKRDNYLKTIFDALVNYLEDENELEVKVLDNRLYISIKEEAVVEKEERESAESDTEDKEDKED